MGAIALAGKAAVRISTTGSGGKTCPLCQSQFRFFLPQVTNPLRSKMHRELDLIGSRRDMYACPVCRCKDRERHQYLYFERLGVFDRLAGARLLHFAPEPQLRLAIKSRGPAEYVAADLFRLDEETVRVDMLDMQFPDESFDVIIANHVLEHVADDHAALDELNRVLAPGGLAVLQVPFSSAVSHTVEGRGLESSYMRVQLHGQDDHVRTYGTDYPKRVASHGFTSLVSQHDDLFAADEADRFGVNPREPLFLFEKAQPSPSARLGPNV